MNFSQLNAACVMQLLFISSLFFENEIILWKHDLPVWIGMLFIKVGSSGGDLHNMCCNCKYIFNKPQQQRIFVFLFLSVLYKSGMVTFLYNYMFTSWKYLKIQVMMIHSELKNYCNDIMTLKQKYKCYDLLKHGQ